MIARKIITLSAGLLLTLAALAQEQKDSTFQKLYQRYTQLHDTNHKDAFHEVSREFQEYYRKKGNLEAYYKLRQNDILYDANHGEAYRAINEANQMLEDMKADGAPHTELVYHALGSIFESRGNYGMAVYYYNEALKDIPPTDTALLASTYAMLANINLAPYPDRAWGWIERLDSTITPESPLYKKYLIYRGEVHFFKKDREKFLESVRRLKEYRKQYGSPISRGDTIFRVMEEAFSGKFDDALQSLDEIRDYNEIRRCNIRIRIYEMMGCHEWALDESNRRRNIRDSLNNDMIFNNLNEVSAAAGIIKLNEQAAKSAKKLQFWMTIAIILMAIALGLLVSRALIRRRFQKKILKQNEQLEIALDEAKEADRMKTIFIGHISHEIRTPLNILTGYAKLLATPGLELPDEERKTLVEGIDENTAAITDIVNNLLEMSKGESKTHYRKDDKIAVNAFCRRFMEDAEVRNNGRLKLRFHTAVSDDLNLRSNQDGIERILEQLVGNALKFTEKGKVELDVYHTSETIQFVVSDTGCGVPAEDQEKIFETFFKVDSFKQGLGIGLAMSRKIATLLGGTLELDKAYHKGTRMILTLPFKEEEDE